MCRTMSSVPPPVAEVTATKLLDHRHRGVQRKHRRTRGVSALMYACQQGDVDRVRLILRSQPFSVTKRDRSGKSPLHYCSNSNYISAAQAADVLVMAAPDLLETPDDEGFTPLHLAVIAGNMPLVTFLLANKADVNAVDSERHTVVHWATVCGETEALRAVLAAGAPVSTPDIHGGYPLHYAAQMCGGVKDSMLGLQVLHTLLSHPDIIPSVEDGDRRQPLLWAASAGSAKAVLALVRAGAAIESCDKDGLTALHCAASRGHTECIDTLLSLCGASPDVIDTNGCTALHYAVTLGHADATALLLAHGANANRQDRKGRSPAHCGCAKGQFETVKLLGSHGANLWLRNARGDLPLHEAAASGRRDLVKWLLEARPSQVNARNNDGRCPLHLAALNDNADMCKILLDTGAHVNPVLRTSKNIFMTPLDCALQRGFRSTAKYLQLNGGLPANRLGSTRQPEIPTPSSFQIRDDVSFLGGSTTDSERENAESGVVHKKRSFRRRIGTRYDRRRDKISQGGEVENTELDEGRQGHPKEKIKATAEEKKQKIRNGFIKESNSMEGTIKHNGDAAVKGAPNYTESPNKTSKTPSKLPIPRESPTKGNKQPISEKGKRPRSAKHKRTKENTTAQSTKNADTKFEKKRQIDENEDYIEVSVQQTKEILEEIVPKLNLLPPDGVTGTHASETTVTTEKSGLQPDQQSLKSNTSQEDVEEQKNFVVEAHVHSPPKSVETVNAETNPSEEQVAMKDQELLSVEAQKQKNGKQLVVEEPPVIDESAEKLSEEKVVDVPIPYGDKTREETKVADIPNKENTLKEKTDENEVGKQTETLPSAEDNVPSKTDEAEVESKSEVPKEEENKKSREDETDTNAEAKEIAKLESNVPADAKIQPIDEVVAENEEKSLAEDDKFSPEVQKPTIAEKRRQLSTQKSIMIHDSSIETKSSQEEGTLSSSSDSSVKQKEHKSFRVLGEDEAKEVKREKQKVQKSKDRRRSRSGETKRDFRKKRKDDVVKKTKIPTPVSVSKSDKALDKSEKESVLDGRIPSVSEIHDDQVKPSRSDSNMSVPIIASAYSDNERGSGSDFEEILSSATRRKRLRKRAKGRSSKSAGSDYESSNLIDSGFEPSPRASRLPKWKNMTERGVNMTSVTQTIQTNIRRYHLERKIFQHLLDLKRLQIRAGQHNEAMLVKRAIDAYHNSCAATVGAGRYIPEDYTFKSFEKFLYHSLRRLQKNGAENLKGLPETPSNAALCTQSTHRCLHATHAYTGVPCAAYLPKMDHHTIPKVGYPCKPSGFLPQINQKKGVTLELCHGSDRQVISLPTDRLDQNKRYYVTFTVKGQENPTPTSEEQSAAGHTHSKSD